MKILLSSPTPLSRELGAPKVRIELAEALRAIGHDAKAILPDAPVEECDVLEFDHEHLQIARSAISQAKLVVARSVLLVQHRERIELPRAKGMRAVISESFKGPRRRAKLRARIARADANMRQADLINVSNKCDRAELIRRGFAAEKIITLPFGLDSSRRAMFDAQSLETPAKPVIAFVGTFDYRKGAPDFPRIFERILREIPNAELRLLGTAGLFHDAVAVRKFFPKSQQDRLRIVPKFATEELPALLSDCTVGAFPSYYEGFGFGVLEMLAAGIPVVAYDAPGPPMMLPPDRLVSAGDVEAMAKKLIDLLHLDRAALEVERRAARESSRKFDWIAIARATAHAYESHLLGHSQR